MAEVQLALQRGPAGFEKLVVVKLVHANLATQKTFVDMLLDEARVAALVKHPNVVDIYDLGEADGRYFIAMEYLEGEPLLAVLRAGREGKRLDPQSTARLVADTAEGLDAAHELRSMGGDPIELVHHDVSLGNIVVLYNGQVKLVDFGVAKASQSTTGPTKIQGKFSYMAPEKLKGGSGDRRSDIWSLGCVLWEALTLRRLFKGGNDADTMKQVLEQTIPTPSSVNGDVLVDFDPIVMKTLERDPEKRYATAKSLAQDLEEVLRKQGYGGRNDQIARYMQATFESHITARKKLLQEVSSKGRASAAVLEAAFSESAAPAITTSSEFSIAFKGPPTPIAEGTPSRPLSRPIQVPALDNEVTMIDAPPLGDDAAASLDAEPVSVSEDIAPASGRNKRLYLGLGALAAVLVLVIVTAVVIASGKSKPESNGSSNSAGTGSAADRSAADRSAADRSAADRSAMVPDAAQVVPDTAVAREPDAEIEMGNDVTTIFPPPVDAAVRPPRDAGRTITPNPPPIPPPTPKPNLAELTSTGVREMAAGNLSGAIATFKKATAVSAGYAPAWRGLGIAYEKQGAKAQAISAFQRYLAHAPGAPDAQAIRDRIERLKK